MRTLIYSIVFVALSINVHAQNQKNGAIQLQDQISVMAYNVENLFDSLDDADRDDDAYRPLTEKNTPEHIARCQQIAKGAHLDECLKLDWSDTVIAEKLKRVANTIQMVDNQKGPDILILEEVENMNILTQLNKKLTQSQYQTVELVEGFDKRGIDVAVLSRFKMISSKIHPIYLNKKLLETRGVLEVNLQIDKNTIITVLAVHMPSQSNPTANRVAAIQTLNQIMLSKPEQQMVIAGGDFNISEEESDLFEKNIGDHWLVSHLDGCVKCEGTYYHSGSWGFLDALLFKDFAKGITPAYEPDLENITVINNGAYQLGPKGTPQKFNFKTKFGVSDHLPIYGTLIKQ